LKEEPPCRCNQCFGTSKTFRTSGWDRGDTALDILHVNPLHQQDRNHYWGRIGKTGSTSIGIRQHFQLWNDIDPVDAEEIHHVTLIFKIQGNRNPYIDNPAWVPAAKCLAASGIITRHPRMLFAATHNYSTAGADIPSLRAEDKSVNTQRSNKELI
jgi:hypothetical protein